MVNRLDVVKSHLKLSNYAGCQALLELMDTTGVTTAAARLRVKRIDSGFPDTDFVRLFTLLLATRHSDFESVRELREDSLIKHLMGLKRLPHANTLREYLGRFEDSHVRALKGMLNLPLAHATLLADPIGLVPVDIDASVFVQHGTQKEGATYAYNGEFGYQPLFAFIGRQGYGMDVTLRPGHHNGIDGAAVDLEQAYNRLPESVARQSLLFRLDAGFYDRTLIETVQALEKHFLIKARVTARLQRAIDEVPAEAWSTDITATNPTVFAELHYQPTGWKRPERFIIRRETLHADGLFPETRDIVYVTNLSHTPADIDACYRRRGQAENFIKELQYDLDLECLPSGRLATNQAFLHLGVLAYNLLVLLGELRHDASLKKNKIGRQSLGTIRRQFITIAGYLRQHARRVQIMLSNAYTLFDEYRALLRQVRSVAPASG